MEHIEMFKQTLSQINSKGSWILSISISVPTWILTKHGIFPNAYHGWLVVSLLIVMVIDLLCSSTLARKSKVIIRKSSTAIDYLIRDFMIILCISLSYLMDYEFQTGSFIFVTFTLAFIWQNFISVMADIYVLGWDKYFPMWLIKLIDNEIAHKVARYFRGE